MEAATKIPSNASAALRSGEFGYPTGHLGHLTAAQESALVDFKKLCTDAKLYNPGSGDNPPSHRDAVLLFVLHEYIFFSLLTLVTDVTSAPVALSQKMRYNNFEILRNGEG